MKVKLDLLFVADCKFEGGTSSAIATEMLVAVRAGYKVGLLMIKGPLLPATFPTHPDIRKLLESGLVERVDPSSDVFAEAVLVHHPNIMENRPTRRLKIRTKMLLLVLHHPMFDRQGALQYDIDRVVENCFDCFFMEVLLAPVSESVRRSLKTPLPKNATISGENWTNLILMEDWPRKETRKLTSPIIVGRHSRPDPLKWPNRRKDALSAYPDDAENYRVRILGAGPYLHELYQPVPANWEMLPFSWDGIPEFLQSLDFYVYFHSDEWSEAFGRTVLEALAVGLVVILPPSFREIFVDAAVYAGPQDVRSVIDRYMSDPEEYQSQSDRAYQFVCAHFSADAYVQRLARFDLQVLETPAFAPVQQPLPEKTVLFVSSNGIGVGHLVQQMAIADRLPASLKSVFVTMSKAHSIVQDAGYLSFFLPHHASIDVAPDNWNTMLAEELYDLIKFLEPPLLAYDATAVFQGVTEVLAEFPDLISVWVRRPMWAPSHQVFMESENSFDLILEPGELAHAFDHGPTLNGYAPVHTVSPVLQIDPSARLVRGDARAALGIPDNVQVVALQLGSGANYDLSGARREILNALLAHPDTLVLDICSPLVSVAPERPDHPQYRQIALFPSFRYSHAFDAAVSVAGYNAFHEQILGAIPTLFVPNEAPDMDRQAARGKWAELTGCGLMYRRDRDDGRARQLVNRLLDADEQAFIRARCQAIRWKNGANEIAEFIEDNARLIRTDRDVTKDIY